MIDRDNLDKSEQIAYKALMALVAEDSVFMLTREKIYRYEINPDYIPFTIHDIRFHKQIMTPVPLILARILKEDSERKRETYDTLFHSTFNNMMDKSSKRPENIILFSKIMSYIEEFKQGYSYAKHKELMKLIYLYSPFVFSCEKFIHFTQRLLNVHEIDIMEHEREVDPTKWFENEFGKDALVPFPIVSNRFSNKSVMIDYSFSLLLSDDYTRNEKIVHALMFKYFRVR